MAKVKIGARVKICEGSGCNSGRVGKVVPMVSYEQCHGHYQQPSNESGYFTVEFDEADAYEQKYGYKPLTHMHKNRLIVLEAA